MKIINHFKTCASIFLAAVLATSCEKPFFDEAVNTPEQVPNKANSTLTITTRSNDSQAEDAELKVSYPVVLYVFDSKQSCIDTREIATEDTPISITLASGNYKVYALAVDGGERYNLPTKEDATAESLITLKSGLTHGDLMTAQANVAMGENEQNTLSLVMERKVMMIDHVEFQNIPANIKSVKLTLSPLYENVTLGGECTGTNGAQTFDLKRKDDTSLSWVNSEPLYLLGSTDKATVKVSIVDENGKVNSFSYVCQESLDANYKINITGTYIHKSFDMSGTIKGVSWLGTKNINFDLKETEVSSDKDGDIVQSDAPAVGTIYKNHYVMKSETEGNTTKVLLMSLSEKNALTYSTNEQTSIKESVDAALAEMKTDGLDLRLPTWDELVYIRSNGKNINANLTTLGKTPLTIDTGNSNRHGYYYQKDKNKISLYFFADGIDSSLFESESDKFFLRGFTELTFTSK